MAEREHGVSRGDLPRGGLSRGGGSGLAEKLDSLTLTEEEQKVIVMDDREEDQSEAAFAIAGKFLSPMNSTSRRSKVRCAQLGAIH
jgi:hypothetical protein